MGTGEIRGDHQILRRPLGMPRELLQFAAMLTMLIDHIGAVLFPEQIILRMIGRIAFPLYAFGIVQGFIYTSDIKRYIKRLGILALISQIPFMLAFHYWEINVIGTLFICICTLFLLEKAQSKVKRIIIVVISWLILQWIPTDYGTYALLLIFIYRYAAHKAILLHFLLNTYYLLTVGVWYQFFSMVSSVWLSMAEAKSRIGSWSIPRWLWISFYPVHLTLLAFIKWLLF